MLVLKGTVEPGVGFDNISSEEEKVIPELEQIFIGIM